MQHNTFLRRARAPKGLSLGVPCSAAELRLQRRSLAASKAGRVSAAAACERRMRDSPPSRSRRSRSSAREERERRAQAHLAAHQNIKRQAGAPCPALSIRAPERGQRNGFGWACRAHKRDSRAREAREGARARARARAWSRESRTGPSASAVVSLAPLRTFST